MGVGKVGSMLLPHRAAMQAQEPGQDPEPTGMTDLPCSLCRDMFPICMQWQAQTACRCKPGPQTKPGSMLRIEHGATSAASRAVSAHSPISKASGVRRNKRQAACCIGFRVQGFRPGPLCRCS